ncbi:MAG TPA: hypothetical protein VFS43_06595 [Polyangiaceae bacterium]|nr:hypothetical protein [Polyangiaceae bacterium]
MSVSPPSRPPRPGSGEGEGPGPEAPWLDDPDAPPTAEELAAARALAEALEGRGEAGREGAEFASALRAAYEPAELDPARHEALLARALGEAGGAKVVRLDERRLAARRALRWGGATTVMAAAAAAVLALWPGGRGEGPAPSAAVAVAPPPALRPSRSTQELFDEPFARSGGGSARIDRIAQARSRDLRQNRFRRWGVP